MKSFAVASIVLLTWFGMTHPVSAHAQGIDVKVTVLGHTGDAVGSASDNFLTFSAPVSVPGVALAPGGYIFRIVNDDDSVMQVLSADRSQVYAMFQVTPTSRKDAGSGYDVTVQRVRDDAPARIVSLFSPNASVGYELTYPTNHERG